MKAANLKTVRRARRKLRVRKRIFGTPQRPRMSITRSLKNLYVQLIDDTTGTTLCEASTRSKGFRDEVGYGGNKQAAVRLGKFLSERAVARGIKKVALDRNGYRFHGRIKALADALREGGLKF